MCWESEYDDMNETGVANFLVRDDGRVFVLGSGSAVQQLADGHEFVIGAFSRTRWSFDAPDDKRPGAWFFANSSAIDDLCLRIYREMRSVVDSYPVFPNAEDRAEMDRRLNAIEARDYRISFRSPRPEDLIPACGRDRY